MPPDPIFSTRATPDPAWKLLAEFSVPNQSGRDHLAGERVNATLKEWSLSCANRERLKAAIAEAILNAVEPDHPQPERLIRIRVLISEPAISGQETSQGQKLIPVPQASDPTSLISGQRLQRGWGFFLIHKTENREQTHPENGYYLIELFLYRETDLSQPNLMTGEVP